VYRQKRSQSRQSLDSVLPVLGEPQDGGFRIAREFGDARRQSARQDPIDAFAERHQTELTGVEIDRNDRDVVAITHQVIRAPVLGPFGVLGGEEAGDEFTHLLHLFANISAHRHSEGIKSPVEAGVFLLSVHLDPQRLSILHRKVTGQVNLAVCLPAKNGENTRGDHQTRLPRGGSPWRPRASRSPDGGGTPGHCQARGQDTLGETSEEGCMKELLIGPGVRCDLSRLIATRLLVQASSGAGKSWLLRRLLEQSHGKVQQIVIDPEGEFASLRERYDYVLAARRGGDTAADPRTAKLLAERLLEVGVSAILDIYELPSHDRVRFVRLFLEALIDAPKKLWHPVLVVLDEAHVYCPETGEAESDDAVKGLCSRGRKRGFCAVLATQRLSKLAKDAAAECNNKLIGRTTLDVDMARAGDELGFTKANRLVLRDLEDGEFFAFGPALSRVVTKVMVGGINTSHPKIGGLAAVAPPPSQRIKALLPKLSDLPAEAEAREKTVTDLKADLTTARRELADAKRDFARASQKIETKIVERPVLKTEQITRLEALVTKAVLTSGELALAAKEITDAIARVGQAQTRETLPRQVSEPATSQTRETLSRQPSSIERNGQLPAGESAILTAVVQEPGLERSRLGVMVGLKKSSRDQYILRLKRQMYLVSDGTGGKLYPTDAGVRALGDAYKPLPTGRALVEHWQRKLPEGELKLFNALLEHGPTLTREALRDLVPAYRKSSSDQYLLRLKRRGLIDDRERGVVSLAEGVR
jgi:Helicase HerA, central domain